MNSGIGIVWWNAWAAPCSVIAGYVVGCPCSYISLRFVRLHAQLHGLVVGCRFVFVLLCLATHCNLTVFIRRGQIKSGQAFSLYIFRPCSSISPPSPLQPKDARSKPTAVSAGLRTLNRSSPFSIDLIILCLSGVSGPHRHRAKPAPLCHI